MFLGNAYVAHIFGIHSATLSFSIAICHVMSLEGLMIVKSVLET